MPSPSYRDVLMAGGGRFRGRAPRRGALDSQRGRGWGPADTLAQGDGGLNRAHGSHGGSSSGGATGLGDPASTKPIETDAAHGRGRGAPKTATDDGVEGLNSAAADRDVPSAHGEGVDQRP